MEKGKYKVINWEPYNKYLKNRGDLTIWFTQEEIEKWVEGEGRMYCRRSLHPFTSRILVIALQISMNVAKVIFDNYLAQVKCPDYDL